MRVSNIERRALERRALGLVVAAVATAALMGGAVEPMGGLDPTPRSENVPPTGDMAPVPAEPAPDAAPAAKDSKDAKGATPAKDGKGEALPWQKKGTATAKKTETKKKVVVTCATVAEDVCRELPACAWLADIPLDDGAVAKAHCTTRTPAVAAKSDAAPVVDATKKSEAKADAKPAAAPGAEAKAEVKPADEGVKAKPAATTGTAKHDQKLPPDESQTSASPPATGATSANAKPFVITTTTPPTAKPTTAPVAPTAPASKKSAEETDQNAAP